MKNPKTPLNQIRLNSFIADCGIASRRKADELIIQGRVTVNLKTITNLGYKIDPSKDKVSVDGEKLKVKESVYYLLNKPKGFVCTTDDEKGRPTVVNLIDTKTKIYPVGRLDYDTTGVLLLTNDGDFAYTLTHPSNNIQREYDVKIDKPLTEDDERKLLTGVFIEGKRGKFNTIKYPTNSQKAPTVSTSEGRNHFVKNMFSTIGYTVVSLHRKSFGSFNVKNLPEGAYRELTEAEIKSIKKIVKKRQK